MSRIKKAAKKINNKRSAVKKAGSRERITIGQRPYYVVCIGASAGGLNAVSELVSHLPSSLHAAVFVVLHLFKSSIGEILAEKIRKSTALPCGIAKHGETIKPGHIYMAPPDAHMLVKNDKIIIGRGPQENRFRPSIDVLFRSAAAHYGERTIGVVLTGYLNDGTAGMEAIRQSGGHCIVQDPNEAEYPDMPLSVLENMQVDHSVSLREIGKVIVDTIDNGEIRGIKPPLNVLAESDMVEKAATDIKHVASLGEKDIYACPDCGGGLWKVKNGDTEHYRCHIGHAYSEKDLVLKQAESIENTIWVAVRMMEERKLLLVKMARDNMGMGLDKLGSNYREQAAYLDDHIGKLKDLLFSIHKQ
jgi:two-component system chemotaxis response regulator CheB